MQNRFLFFWLSLFLFFFFPTLPLLFFAPYLVACSYRFTKLATLSRSLCVAIFLSLFSSEERFALLPLSYCFATFFLYFHCHYFFADKRSTLPIMTYLFSFYASLFYFLLLPLFHTPITFSWSLFATEILIAPLSDTLLAGILTLMPLKRKEAM